MTVDTSRFDAAMKAYLLTTSRDLHKAVNSRFFFLMVRLFVLVPPKSPQAERTRIGDYLSKPLGDINRVSKKTGKRIGMSRLLRRVHLIAQARERKAGRRGLYGVEMKEAASSIYRKAIGSVGYLRSGVVKAIRVFNKGFSQFSKPKWKPLVKPAGYKPPHKPNATLVALANQYGLPQENVATHKGTKARGYQAVPGWDPTASVMISTGIADNQISKVEHIMSNAMQRAYDDETAELVAHMTDAMLENGKVLVDNGFDIK
ncbi:MAG: hypothetical protein ACO3BH_14915 [Quisquiliibacterium sp.]